MTSTLDEGVNGQRHAPAALYPREKDHRYPLDRRLGGPQCLSGHRVYRKNPFPLPGIEPGSPGRPARSQDTILTELPGSLLPSIFRPTFIYHVVLNLLN
jgi:hypothetical protein